MFLRNAWYAAAWSTEIDQALFVRRLLDEPVLFYRLESGDVAAIGDRCPHRFAPLHLGKRLGDVVQCPYHGLRFDRSGACVHSPHGDGTIPSLARVRAYEVVERYGLVWIWMGDPARADRAAIPRFDYLFGPGFATAEGYVHAEVGYLLFTDNLLDLSHAEFVHAGTLGTNAISRGVVEIKQAGSTVQSNRFCADGPLPPQFATLFPVGGRQVDHWMDMRWDPPGAMLLEVGVSLAGRPRDEGVALFTTHIVTPETATSTHYFHASSRNFRIDDVALTAASRERQRRAFVDEDKPMLEAQQRMIGDADFQSLKPVLLASDAGSARVRRVLERLILVEQRQRDESTQTTTATA